MPPPWTSSKPTDAHQTTAAAAPRVLLVVNDPLRRQLMQAAVALSAPHCHVEVVDNALDGMARSVRMPAHLLVIDVAVDRVIVPALVRYLSRVAPWVTVHLYDSAPASSGTESLEAQKTARPAEDNSDALQRMQGGLLQWLASQASRNPSVL